MTSPERHENSILIMNFYKPIAMKCKMPDYDYVVFMLC
jgi:hypothetical protein